MDSFESKPLKGLKIGFIHEKLEEGVHSGVRSATKEAASHLEGLDCVLTEVFSLTLCCSVCYLCTNT